MSDKNLYSFLNGPAFKLIFDTGVRREILKLIQSGGGGGIVSEANLAALPATGTADVIYITEDTNSTYRWDGSTYVQIGGGSGSGGATVINKTASYTLTSGDNGKTIVFNSASSVNCTVPSGLPIGFNCLIIQIGVGDVTLVPSSTTINNADGYTTTARQYAITTLLSYNTNIYISSGDMV